MISGPQNIKDWQIMSSGVSQIRSEGLSKLELRKESNPILRMK